MVRAAGLKRRVFGVVLWKFRTVRQELPNLLADEKFFFHC